MATPTFRATLIGLVMSDFKNSKKQAFLDKIHEEVFMMKLDGSLEELHYRLDFEEKHGYPPPEDEDGDV